MIQFLLLFSFFIKINSDIYEIKDSLKSIKYNSSKTINLYYEMKENNYFNFGIANFIINDSAENIFSNIKIKSKIIFLEKKEEINLNFPILKEEKFIIKEKEKKYQLFHPIIFSENKEEKTFLLIEINITKNEEKGNSNFYYFHSKNENYNFNIENYSNNKIIINNFSSFSQYLIQFNMSKIEKGNFVFNLNSSLENLYIEIYENLIESNFKKIEKRIIPFKDLNLILHYNKNEYNKIFTIGLFYLNNFLDENKKLYLQYFFSQYDYFINNYDFEIKNNFPIQFQSCFNSINFIINYSKDDNFSYFFINEKIFGDYNINEKRINNIFYNEDFFKENFNQIKNEFIEINSLSIIKLKCFYPSNLNIKLIKIPKVENLIEIKEENSFYKIDFDKYEKFKFVFNGLLNKINVKILFNSNNFNLTINYSNKDYFFDYNNYSINLNLIHSENSFILSKITSDSNIFLINIIKIKEENPIIINLNSERNFNLNLSSFYFNITSINELFNFKIQFERNDKIYNNYSYLFSLSSQENCFNNINISKIIYPSNYSLSLLNPYKYNFDYYLIYIKFPTVKLTKIYFYLDKPLNYFYPNSFINLYNIKNNFTLISYSKKENTKILFQFLQYEKKEQLSNKIINFTLFEINNEKISYEQINIPINKNKATFISQNYFSDCIIFLKEDINNLKNLFLYISYINPKKFHESNYSERNLTLKSNETNINIKIPKITNLNNLTLNYQIYISENLSLSKYDILSNFIKPNQTFIINNNNKSNNSNFFYNIQNLKNDTEYILYILNSDNQTYYIYDSLKFKTQKNNSNQENTDSNILPYYWIILLVLICLILICVILVPIIYYCFYLRKKKIKDEENFNSEDLDSVQNKNGKIIPSGTTIEGVEVRHLHGRLSTNISYNNALHKHK